MNKVVITGATGMIGRTLIEILLKKDIKILAIVRENSKRYLNLPKSSNLQIIQCDLKDLHKLDVEENDYDTFFHFAWEGTLGNTRNDEQTQKSNIKATLDALKLANRLGCKTFIGAGSQAEFGRIEGIINEKCDVHPETEYGKAKLLAGIKSRELAQKLGIKHIWARIFSAYGPYDNEKTMVMNSIKTMLEKKESPEYTKGEQMWDYIYSEDVAMAFYLLAEKGKNNELYCIAYGKARPLKEYIEIIRTNIDRNINLKLGVIPYTDKQVMNLSVNIDKLKKDTGFSPKTKFEDGIQKIIEWYKGDENNEKN